jgi:hypothetical protein
MAAKTVTEFSARNPPSFPATFTTPAWTRCKPTTLGRILRSLPSRSPDLNQFMRQRQTRRSEHRHPPSNEPAHPLREPSSQLHSLQSQPQTLSSVLNTPNRVSLPALRCSTVRRSAWTATVKVCGAKNHRRCQIDGAPPHWPFSNSLPLPITSRDQNCKGYHVFLATSNLSGCNRFMLSIIRTEVSLIFQGSFLLHIWIHKIFV